MVADMSPLRSHEVLKIPRRKRIGVKRYSHTRSHIKTSFSKAQTRYGTQRIAHKTRVLGFTTKRRYWGPATPIKVRPILRFDWRHSDDEINEMLLSGTLPKPVEKALGKSSPRDLYQLRADVRVAVMDGCRIGFKKFTDNISPYIAQRSGTLRADVEATVKASIPPEGQKDLPVIIQIGAPNVQYASIVNKYTPQFIQLQHVPGKQYSGVQRRYKYNARLGDPKAQYHFFGICSMQCRKAMKDGISEQLTFYHIPWAVFVYLVKVIERVVQLV